MALWQPDPNLPPSDRDDVRDGHYMRFTHELHKMGELATGWADEVSFYPAKRNEKVVLPIPITIMAEQAVVATVVAEGQPSAA